jgi:hypothetical protein
MGSVLCGCRGKESEGGNDNLILNYAQFNSPVSMTLKDLEYSFTENQALESYSECY